MKNLILLLLVVTLSSCSDELTENKIETIIEDCLEARPISGKRTLIVGKKNIYKNSKKSLKMLDNYTKLEQSGFLDLEKLSENNTTIKYNISATEKLNKIATIQKNTFGFGSSSNRLNIKTYEYELDEIIEIHEIPSSNLANVKLVFKPTNYTDFANVLSIKGKIKKQNKTFRKTNNGWTGSCK